MAKRSRNHKPSFPTRSTARDVSASIASPTNNDTTSRTPFAVSRTSAASPHATTGSPETSSPQFASSLLSSGGLRSEEHTSELQSLAYLVCRLLLEKKKKNN